MLNVVYEIWAVLFTVYDGRDRVILKGDSKTKEEAEERVSKIKNCQTRDIYDQYGRRINPDQIIDIFVMPRYTY